jgi:phage terminase large subunit
MLINRPIRHVVRSLPSQQRFYDSPARYKGFSGPVGSGKTYALCHEALRAACRNPGCTGLLGAPTYPHLYDVTIPTMEGILEELGMPFRIWKGARPRIYLERQAVSIVFRSLENPNRLRGLNLAWFGIDELTYCRAEAWQVLCQRIRQPQAQRLEGFAVWTPKGYDWVYQHFISPKRKLAGYDAILAGPMENVVVLDAHPEYYESLKAQYDEQFYRQEVLGEYLNIYAGACYHAFDEQRCAEQRTQFEANLNGLAWALDFNIEPMASLICQIKGPRRLDVLQEITISVGNAERMCDAFVAAAQPYLQAWRAARGGFPLPVKLYGDASGHARSLVGKTVYAVIEQYFRIGARDFKLEMNANISNPSVIDRVASVNAMLYNARGEIGCFIDPNCKELITDFFETSWCKDNQHEIDKKRDHKRTHWSDALGYLIYRDFKPDAFRRQIDPVNGRPYYPE